MIAYNNFSVIAGSVAGEYHIIGLLDAETNTPTTINGTTDVTVNGMTGAVSIELNDGSDEVLVQKISTLPFLASNAVTATMS